MTRRFPIQLAMPVMAAAAVLAGCGSSNTAPTAGSSATGGADTTVPRCTAAQLAATLGDAKAAGGTAYYPLNLRNTGASACAIRGYAGVSFVAGDDNHQVGHAAGQDTGPLSTITLLPGQTATAPLGIEDSANLPADCDATPPTGLRVTPPDQTAALVIDPAGIACSNPKYTTLHIGPFRSGASGTGS